MNGTEAAEEIPMKIKAVKLYENGFMTQAFAMGGEGTDGIDPTVRYRSSLQNYVIDTGSEVILVDTGMPSEAPDAVPDEKTPVYMGTRNAQISLSVQWLWTIAALTTLLRLSNITSQNIQTLSRVSIYQRIIILKIKTRDLFCSFGTITANILQFVKEMTIGLTQ